MKSTLKAIAFAAALVSTAASATVLTTQLHVDNGYIAYLSTSNSTTGLEFASGNSWYDLSTGTVSLDKGTDYYLHVYAYDQGGVAGLLAQLGLSGTDHQFSNGLQSLLSNTTDWTVSTTGFGGAYSAASSFGGNGVSPWGGQTGDLPAAATWIWSGDNDLNDNIYFSTKISAVNEVPEPGSLALLGLGLLGAGMIRRKKA